MHFIKIKLDSRLRGNERSLAVAFGDRF